MRLSVGESLLSCLVGIYRNIALKDEAQGAVIGHVVPKPVEQDDDFVAYR